VLLLTPVVVVGVIAGVALWVLADARRWSRQGTPVVFRFGSATISRPEAWAVACLLVFVIFMPIYVVARRA
jgi:hypothetical protein